MASRPSGWVRRPDLKNGRARCFSGPGHPNARRDGDIAPCLDLDAAGNSQRVPAVSTNVPRASAVNGCEDVNNFFQKFLPVRRIHETNA